MTELFDLKKELELRSAKMKETNNDKILSVLKQLSEYYISIKTNQQKINAINKAIASISSIDRAITSGSVPKIPMVGPGIAKRIDEIIETGTLSELPESDTVSSSITELCQVVGIGPVKAKQLVAMGINNVPELIKTYADGTLRVGKNMLTHSIIIGIKYYYDLKERIPREEMTELHRKINSALSRDYSIKICGSYRRKLKTSGDIDVLLSHSDYIHDVDNHEGLLHAAVDQLQSAGIIIDSLTFEGQTKFMGIAQSMVDGPGRRIDIRLISKEAKPFAILYFTGSGEFNKIMRTRALDLGYSLNEYFLINVNTGKKIMLSSEKEIFEFLLCKYVKPEDR